MATLSSNTLFHFTDSAEKLLGILKNEFYPRHSLEDISIEGISKPIAFPMVCFCDIPLSQIKNHLHYYGRYCIGMTKEWASVNGLNPVLYLRKGSKFSKNLSVMAKEFLFSMDKVGEAEFYKSPSVLFFDVLRYMKSYKGILYKNGQQVNGIKFYDEREWRYVPDLEKCHECGCSGILTKVEFDNKIIRAQADSKAERTKLSFGPDDIRYIIVYEENEILPMFQAVMDIKEKYEDCKKKLLTTRIITTKQIENDF